jgi:predicted HAD superfamily phosphohydrolase
MKKEKILRKILDSIEDDEEFEEIDDIHFELSGKIKKMWEEMHELNDKIEKLLHLAMYSVKQNKE